MFSSHVSATSKEKCSNRYPIFRIRWINEAFNMTQNENKSTIASPVKPSTICHSMRPHTSRIIPQKHRRSYEDSTGCQGTGTALEIVSAFVTFPSIFVTNPFSEECNMPGCPQRAFVSLLLMHGYSYQHTAGGLEWKTI